MGIKVLVADDSAFMRNIIKDVLSQVNVTDVIEAADGEEAVTRYKETTPNLVFMDIMMPKKTGLVALREIRAEFETANIVMCTSVGQEKVVQEAVEGGASDFITKPFKPDDIKEIVRKYNA